MKCKDKRLIIEHLCILFKIRFIGIRVSSEVRFLTNESCPICEKSRSEYGEVQIKSELFTFIRTGSNYFNIKYAYV